MVGRMRRWSLVGLACLLAGALGLLVTHTGKHPARQHTSAASGLSATFEAFIRNSKGTRGPAPPCSVEGDRCVRGCQLAVSQHSSAGNGCGSQAKSHACLEMITHVSAAKQDGSFCAQAGETPLERAFRNRRKR
jgi:hypothetical protein